MAVLDYLRRSLQPSYDLKVFSDRGGLLDSLNKGAAPDLILLEWESMEKSLAALSHIRASLPDVPIVMLSCTAEVKDFEVVTRIGARGIVLKPFLDGNLESAIEEHLAQARKAIPAEPQEIPLDETHSFVRSSKRMCELQAQAALVAKSDIPVLILGESGTGKEILALYTHKMSNRAQPHVPEGELRRDAGRPARERALRLRAGRVHWRHEDQARQVRGLHGRNDLPR